MPRLETLADLITLHTNLVLESSTLEYKASPAITNTPGAKAEMSKDISAMANAEGGQFVYAMTEAGHLPAGLDGGVSATPFDGLWFEQAIQENIHPKIPNLKILLIPLGNGNNAVVVTVPQSATIHQAKDRRYYRRRNFRNDMMEDYEIREALNRSKAPDLSLSINIDGARYPFPVTFQDGADVSNEIPLSLTIQNSANEPALYSYVSFLIEEAVIVRPSGNFEIGGLLTLTNGKVVRAYNKKLAIPGSFPVFKGLPLLLTNPHIVLLVHRHMRDTSFTLQLGYQIYTPGFSAARFLELVYDNNTVALRTA